MDDESLIEFRKLARTILMNQDEKRRFAGERGNNALREGAKTPEEGDRINAMKVAVNERLNSIWWNRFTDAYIVAMPLIVFLVVVFFPGMKGKNASIFIALMILVLLFAVTVILIINSVTRLFSGVETEDNPNQAELQTGNNRKMNTGNKKLFLIPTKNALILTGLYVGTFALATLFAGIYRDSLSDNWGQRTGYAIFGCAAASFLLAYIFVPQFMRRTSVIADINTFAYGEKRDDYDGFLHKTKYDNIDKKTILLGYLRTFDVDTTINLDDAMANMREAIGYSVVREEDAVDYKAFIDDVIVPRILATKRPVSYDFPSYKSNKDAQECDDEIKDIIKDIIKKITKKLEDGVDIEDEELQNLLKEDTHLGDLKKMWSDDNKCKAGVFNLCKDLGKIRETLKPNQETLKPNQETLKLGLFRKAIDNFYAKTKEILKPNQETLKPNQDVNASASNLLFDKLKCDAKLDSSMTFDNFMWKPKLVTPIHVNYAEACFEKCKEYCPDGADNKCTAAVYENGLCYIQESSSINVWEVDTQADGARVYLPSGLSNLDTETAAAGACASDAGNTVKEVVLPVYATGDAVEEILNDIQSVSPIIDMSPYEDDIRDALIAKDPAYESNKAGYDSIIAALVSESALRSDERTPIEDGGNLKADIETVREYFATKTLNKFNREIAWPVVKAGVNVTARNQIFDRIAGRRRTIFEFYHWMFHVILVSLTAFAAYSVFFVKDARGKTRLNSGVWESVFARPYPTVPFAVVVIVFLVSLFVLLERRRLRFINNITVQSENAANFGAALTELSNLFSSFEYATDRRPEDVVDIPAGLQEAVFENDMGKAKLRSGSSPTDVLEGAYTTKDRARLLRKMAKVLEEYDRCNNVLYRGGVPFPTALVTAYLGLIALGIGLLFSVPEVNPTRLVRNIELARALAHQITEASVKGFTETVRSYRQQLCDLWDESMRSSGNLKNVMQNTSVFLSVIFGVLYVVQTATDASKFSKVVGAGILGVVGDCV